MIVRADDKSNSAICITQTHHSKMTGALAGVWGNHLFAVPEHFDTVRFAASIHDIGWIEWEKSPEIDPQNGLPYSFLKMPKAAHLQIWEEGVTSSLGFGLLPALLVLRHNAGLAAKQPLEELEPEWREPYSQFFEKTGAQEKEIMQSILKMRNISDPDEITDFKNRVDSMNRLILFLDYISLRMCMGTDAENPFGPPPDLNGRKFEMKPHPSRSEIFMLNPWPFGVRRFEWNCEAFRFTKGQKVSKSMSENRMMIPMKLVPFSEA